jgi:hypothetical protein
MGIQETNKEVSNEEESIGGSAAVRYIAAGRYIYVWR